MTVIKAAVLRSFGEPLVIEDLTLRSPQASEVRVEIDAVAICHSDITFFDGGWGGDLPAVYGHEAAGRVVEIGSDVSHVAIGDRVVVTLIRSCGKCRPCRRGRPVACQSKPDTGSPLTDASGATIAHGLFCGAFAEQVVVHHSQIVPVDLDAAPASLLACGVVTGTGAVLRSATVSADDRVVVSGGGGGGLEVHRIMTDEELSGESLDRRGQYPRSERRTVGLTPTDRAVVGGDLHQGEVGAAERRRRVRNCERLDLCDPHESPP